MASLPKTNYHLQKQNPLYQRVIPYFEFEDAFAYLHFVKEGKVQKLMHELKYRGKSHLSQLLGNWYGSELVSHHPNQYDWVLPVPLHKSRYQQRGYNQSDGFAEALALHFRASFSNQILLRQKANQTQTRKSRLERWQNVADIFVVAQSDAIKDKHILLADDVITTGATLAACAQALKAAGAKKISIAAIAIAQS